MSAKKVAYRWSVNGTGEKGEASTLEEAERAMEQYMTYYALNECTRKVAGTDSPDFTYYFYYYPSGGVCAGSIARVREKK